jgi:ATP-dependent Lon protease
MKYANDNMKSVVSVGQIDIDPTRFDVAPNVDDLLILPTRNLVMFPDMTLPLSLVRDYTDQLAHIASENKMPVGIVLQLSPETEDPKLKDLYKYGVIADILKVLELPDGSKTAIVRSRQKFRILGKGAGEAAPGFLSARVKIIEDVWPKESDKEFMPLIESIKRSAINIVNKSLDQPARQELSSSIENVSNPAQVMNLIATHLPLELSDKQDLLSILRIKDRALKLLELLTRSEEYVDISRSIMERARQSMEQNQRTAFLQHQMDAIKDELYGEDDDEITDLEKRSKSMNWPQAMDKTFAKELEKLRRYNPQSPDYSVQYTYLDTLLSLPWNFETVLNDNFAEAEEILNNDHYGLEKVKERILEQLALMIDNPHGKSPIICLVGPPGVGKTSLGASIAHALGRNYQRVSLGGLHDEAEIRGHRRTYVGAMPGRIIDAMKRAGSSNPVLLLDEIDKIGADFKGDPAAALLEVLDPAQNYHFHDNYIDVDYDLSHVLFIATANTLSTISRPLLDRIEVIDLSGYLLEEKIEIAKRHLLPRILEAQGLDAKDVNISDEALTTIIDRYTSESGVRQLEKRLSAVMRKAVLARKRGQDFPSPVMPADLKDILGIEPFLKDVYEGNEFAGVVTGLAWTEVGGTILLVETSISEGAGEKLTLTGNLGDVMKESATIALQWVKAHATDLGIDHEMFKKYNFHVHFPEGAIPKDGPSAGIAMATSMVSALKGVRVKERLAMTGEITLRGKVLPVGGIKEKILAAKRAGITEIILSSDNRKDVEDIDGKYLEGLTFTFVTYVSEVLDKALTDIPAIDRCQ